MNESMDRALADWLRDGPDQGPREGLERALAAARQVSQRPAWAIPERWLPMQLTMQRAPTLRPVLLLATVLLLVLALVAAAVIVGSQQRLPDPFGPAGNGLVAYDAGGKLYLSSSDFSESRVVEGGLGAAISPVFSRDGRQLAFWSGTSPNAPTRHLFVAAVGDPAPARQLSDKKNPTLQAHGTPPAWTIDGSRLIYAASSEGRIRLASTAVDGSGVTFLTEPDLAPWTPFMSPDGKWLAFRSRRPEATLMVMPVEGGAPKALLSVEEASDAFVNMAWSLDSTRIVYHRPHPEGGGPVVETIDIRDGTIRRVSREGELGADPSWSPDGRWIAYGIEIAGVRHTVLAAPDGTEYRDLGTVGGCVMGWSPDAKYLFGFTTDCFSSKLMRIPLDDPGAAVEFGLPGALTGQPDWQRVAP